jgi:hypothetical protein
MAAPPMMADKAQDVRDGLPVSATLSERHCVTGMNGGRLPARRPLPKEA